MTEKLFKLAENNTNVRTEIIAGITTFLTMSYIIFVQPAILSHPFGAGMDFNSVFMATCIAAAIATFVMGLLANYPIALAPGMGQNVYFSFIVCGTMGVMTINETTGAEEFTNFTWNEALGAVFIAGAIFLFLSFFKFREKVIDAIPRSLKLSIAGGIGLLIAMVGLQYAGLVADDPVVLVRLGDPSKPWTVLSIIGLLIIGILLARKVKGAILIGMIATAVIGLFVSGGVETAGETGSTTSNLVSYQGLMAPPPSMSPTLFKMDLAGFFQGGSKLWLLWEIVFIFFFMDLFDTIGTLLGVGNAAGLLRKDGKLPRAGKALISDAVGTVAGASMGTSTVTSYIESATGVSEGGRTGLASMVTGVLFLLAIFFKPLVAMVGGGFDIDPDPEVFDIKYPVIAAPLIIVGSLMMKGMKDVEWDDPALAIAAFITVILMPLTFSIATGISFGLIAYAVIKLLSGKGKDVHWLLYILAVVFILRYAFIAV